MKIKTLFGIPVVEKSSVPEGTIYFVNTTEIKWKVPSNKKDKSLRLKGKKIRWNK